MNSWVQMFPFWFCVLHCLKSHSTISYKQWGMWVCCVASQVTWCAHSLQLLMHQGPNCTYLADKISRPCPERSGSLLVELVSLRRGFCECRSSTTQTDLFPQTCVFNILSTKVLGFLLLKHLHGLSIFPFGLDNFEHTPHSTQNPLPFVIWVDNSEWSLLGCCSSSLPQLWLSRRARSRHFSCLGDLPT